MQRHRSDDSAHLSDDLVELYALDRLVGAELAAVEEHPLACPACQDRLKETDEFLTALRAALLSVNIPWDEFERELGRKGT